MASSTERNAEKPLTGQVVLVTGGGRGIGSECARTAAEAGASVAVAATTEVKIRSVAKEIRVLGANALHVQTDVSSVRSTKRMIRETVSALGGLDVLINAAGVDGPRGPVQEMNPKLWQRAFAVNVNGVFLCCRAAIPEMFKRGRGHIINISSVLARRPAPHAICYSATKWAVGGSRRDSPLNCW